MMDLSSDMASLEDDIQEFNIEKDVRTSLKSQEELDKLTVDETLSDVDRAVYLLSSGQEVQFLSVIHNLPSLLKGWQNESIRRVLPKVKEMLHTAGLDVQLAATEVFTTVAKEELLPIAVYTQHFLRAIITNMNTKEPASSQAWLDTLLSVIPFLPRETVRREVLGLAIAKGQLSQPTASRLSCCSILGAVAVKFDAHIVKKDIVHTVKQLCQDVEHNVRACMCSHLHSVAAALGAEETRKCILDEVVELAGDEESQVREAAMEALLNMTDLLDDDCLVQHVVPLVCKYCEQALQNEDHTMLSVAKNFGRFCHNISKNFNAEQHAWLLSIYRKLCTIGRTPLDLNDGGQDPITLHITPPTPDVTPTPPHQPNPEKMEDYLECRRLSAYNFPAVVVFCLTESFEHELLECASLLCTDADPQVRKHFASGLHEVAQSLEALAYLVQPHLVLLLRERHVPGVLDACLRRLPDTLTAVIIRGNLADNKVNGVTELIGALLAALSRLEQQWPSVWRPLETLVTHLRRLPDVITSDQIYYKFAPIIFKLLTTNHYLPVRQAAASTVCVFIRHNRKMEQRREMWDRLIQDLCYSRNYRNRNLFFDACRHMMALFSRSFFKEHLFEHVLGLFNDPVPNVRLCLCKILPSMKGLLKLPKDRSLHGQLETNVRKLLSSEKDRDVSIAIRTTILELDRTEVAMESLTAQHHVDVDLQDQRKEEEELMLLQQELKNKDEDARSLRSHGSSHSSSSVGKAMANRSDKKKKRNNSVQSSTQSSLLKVNGKDKEKSRSLHQLDSRSNPGYPQQREGILANATGSGISSVLYNLGSSTSPRSLPNHFATHSSYLTGANNPANQGPSTALGHKGPPFHGQQMGQTRSSPLSASAGFIGSIPIAQPNQPTSSTHQTNKTTRKTDRRKASALSHQNTASQDEPRTRKDSTGSASSTGSGSRKGHQALRRKGSLPGSPIGASSNRTRKEKNAR
ncbi:serine/threonine-protein phosphatase 4 regulatory subunit 4-like [Ciona intestinalis]